MELTQNEENSVISTVKSLDQVKQVPIVKTKEATKEELIANIKEWIKLDNEIAKAKSDI